MALTPRIARIAAVVAAGALSSVALAACASSTDNASGDDPITIEYLHRLPDGDGMVPVADIVQRWNEENPNVQVKSTKFDGKAQELILKLETDIKAGNAACLAQTGYSEIPQLFVKGLLEDVSDETKKYEQHYSAGAFSGMRAGEAVVGIPQDTGPLVYYYSEPAFAALGIDVPSTLADLTAVIKLLSDNNIRLSIFDKFGYLIGSFYPEKYSKTSIVFLKQCEVFINNESRLKMAKIMENVALYNIRSNLRYYYKNNKRFKSYITFINKCIKDMNEAKTIEKCLLVEARARYKYYESFNLIIKEKDFEFKQRTKQPPKDELNALISFGNTLLYSFFLKAISKSSLSSRIGVIHSTNKRSNSLNLDFADMYKPIIVDRVIFSCINKRQIRKEHFINVDNDGVYLSDDGKRIFIKEFEDKLYTQIEYKGFKTTYKQALEKDVFNYQASLNKNIKYHPFKYY